MDDIKEKLSSEIFRQFGKKIEWESEVDKYKAFVLGNSTQTYKSELDLIAKVAPDNVDFYFSKDNELWIYLYKEARQSSTPITIIAAPSIIPTVRVSRFFLLVVFFYIITTLMLVPFVHRSFSNDSAYVRFGRDYIFPEIISDMFVLFKAST
jgi:hypothetical protein